MGRDGPILWPARSPNLSLYGFFLWGYSKDIVYQTPQSLADFKQNIRSAIQSINAATLEKAYENLETRLNFVVRNNGGHFEHDMQ